MAICVPHPMAIGGSVAARVTTFFKVFGFWLLYFWAARALFLSYHHVQASELPPTDLFRVFARGFRLDASAAAYLSALPAGLLALSVFRPLLGAARRLVWTWTTLAVVASSLLVTTDLELFRHWDRRVDGAVLGYLRTPTEAWASTGGTPRAVLLVMAAALTALALLGFRRFVAGDWARLAPGHPLGSVPLACLAAALVIPARGGIQEISLTQSSAYFSPRPFANVAAQNALWGFFDSIYRGLYDRTNHFRTLDPDSARRAVAAARAADGAPVPTPLSTTRPNILLIVWESASARVFGSLGGVPGITPRFDSLTREGILFRRFYAAGDRTDKGLGAILSGFPALPRGGILKVPVKARSLPRLSRDLAAANYSTSFYYGGELEFASLQAYLVEAGFDRIVGKAEFPRSTWNSKWGAHDGVVASRLLDDLDRAREPFFSVWLTLSSHEPFETPEPPRFAGRDWQAGFFNAMAYTDAVVGRLIDAARNKPWWRNTLIVVVADHGRRVLPLDESAPFRDADALFRVPMLWLGGALRIQDSTVDAVSSQLDITPTLLALTGIAPTTPYPWGRSLLTPVALPAAYYGFDGGFGLVTLRGALVYDHAAGRVVSRTGAPTDEDERLGRALMQLTYQDYLDR